MNLPEAFRVTLEFVKPVIKEDKDVVVQVSNLEEPSDVKKWKKALVGYVFGDDPLPSSMENFIDENWRKYGNVELHSLECGVFIFVFETLEGRQQVLDQAPWFFEVKPIILKPWKANLILRKQDVESLPVWIKLSNLNMHLWSPHTFATIASGVGKPLFTDKLFTTASQRLKFPRICVEVNGLMEIPSYVRVIDEYGYSYIVSIDYEWKPPRCKYCKCLGHSDDDCRSTLKILSLNPN